MFRSLPPRFRFLGFKLLSDQQMDDRVVVKLADGTAPHHDAVP